MPTPADLPTIHTFRATKVVLDGDLAKLYGVTTKRLLEQVRRNANRFPPDFCFQLENDEMAALRSQIATLKAGRGRHRKLLPFAFTKHGALQAANVINSLQATQMSIDLVRAFIRMRAELASGAGILKRVAAIDRQLLVHNAQDNRGRISCDNSKPQRLADNAIPTRPSTSFYSATGKGWTKSTSSRR